MEPVIRLENVWKAYGNSIAVRGLSLAVPPRSIYGFLGPNGAGKSTTIRIILGLQRPDGGVIRIFGDPTNLPTLARIGSLVESPSLYLHLTGRENLEVHRRLLGTPKNAIDEALEIVGLRPVAGRAVRGYSSGNKGSALHRLCLAARNCCCWMNQPTGSIPLEVTKFER
jgi:lantibiotic transport system ATP-binding protein